MSYSLYSAPSVPDRGSELLAVLIGFVFVGLIAFVASAQLWFGRPVLEMLPVYIVGFIPVCASVLALFLLRRRRRRDQEMVEDHYHQLREGLES